MTTYRFTNEPHTFDGLIEEMLADTLKGFERYLAAHARMDEQGAA